MTHEVPSSCRKNHGVSFPRQFMMMMRQQLIITKLMSMLKKRDIVAEDFKYDQYHVSAIILFYSMKISIAVRYLAGKHIYLELHRKNIFQYPRKIIGTTGSISQYQYGTVPVPVPVVVFVCDFRFLLYRYRYGTVGIKF